MDVDGRWSQKVFSRAHSFHLDSAFRSTFVIFTRYIAKDAVSCIKFMRTGPSSGSKPFLQPRHECLFSRARADLCGLLVPQEERVAHCIHARKTSRPKSSSTSACERHHTTSYKGLHTLLNMPAITFYDILGHNSQPWVPNAWRIRCV